MRHGRRIATDAAMVALIGFALFLLAACDGEGASVTPPGGTTTDDPVREARIRCASETRSLVVLFISAFNRGDLTALDRIFSSEPTFDWYSESNEPGRRIRDDAKDRESLLDYFASRHRAMERLQLTHYRFHGKTRGHGGVVFRVMRSAADLHPARLEDGKADINCTLDPPSIAVWSMGRAA